MEPEARGGAGATFPQTHWSAVLAAGGSVVPAAEAALAELCRAYWYPLYAYARRNGHNVDDAQDLTQGFFAHLIRVRLVARADSSKGRFRSFLLVSFKRFIASEHARAEAQKRGGHVRMLSLDVNEAESRLRLDSDGQLSPDLLYDRSWALTLLDRVLRRMAGEFQARGRSAVFQQLCPYLQGINEAPPYAEAARKLGTTEGTISVTVYRMRRRYRELLRATVLETLEDPAQVDDELEHLRAALRQ